MQWEIIAVGFAVGALIGMTGVGGGVLMTPLLILFFHVQPSIAIGTDLFYASVTKLMGAVRHWQQGTVNVGIASTLATGSIPTALFGIGIAKSVKNALGPGAEPMISTAVAWVCIFVAAAMVLRVIVERRSNGRARGLTLSPAQQKVLTLVLGVLTGILVGLTSIGAGSIVMIFLVMLYPLSTKQLVGTDIFHAAILASVSAIGQFWAGNIDFSLAGMLLVGSIPGVVLGSRISLRLPDSVLRVSLAVMLAASGTRLILG